MRVGGYKPFTYNLSPQKVWQRSVEYFKKKTTWYLLSPTLCKDLSNNFTPNLCKNIYNMALINEKQVSIYMHTTNLPLLWL